MDVIGGVLARWEGGYRRHVMGKGVNGTQSAGRFAGK